MKRPKHFQVTGHRRGERAQHLDLIAFDPKHAITSAAELLPGYLITTPAEKPMWQDGPV